LTIGDELLKGSVLNTNAQYLGSKLTHLGFSVTGQAACPDDVPAIRKKLTEFLSRSHLVIVSGGLGPTPDDVTREAISSLFKVPLVFSESQFRCIQAHYRKHSHHAVPREVRKEAFYPQNAVPLINRFGIALGFFMNYGNGGLMIVLPGVPRELENMFEALVGPLLKRHFKNLKPKPKLVVRMAGISEPAVMKKLGKDFFEDPFDFGIYPEAGEVSIRLYAESSQIIKKLKRKLKKQLNAFIYAYGESSLTETIGKILTRRKKTLAIAESCTGGLLSSEITRIPGASRYFKGSMTAYDNSVKSSMGIEKALIEKKGAASKEVARALAVNIRRQMNTTYGIGITGIAGPSGGSRKKPVGLVYISIAAPHHASVHKHLFWGDRLQVQTKAVIKALEYLWQEIR
jgi:nicotinamide-nucleotide amidase